MAYAGYLKSTPDSQATPSFPFPSSEAKDVRHENVN